jgi:hypothetical protein
VILVIDKREWKLLIANVKLLIEEGWNGTRSKWVVVMGLAAASGGDLIGR